MSGNQLSLELLNATFFKLCDTAVEIFKIPYYEPVHLASRDGGQNKDLQTIAHFRQAHQVCALAVAHDMTGKEAYLDTMRTWADAMLTAQDKMIPRHAYYMGYGRPLFSPTGSCWCVCDASEIATGVLATAVRCRHPLEKRRYLRSVENYANLILENYVGINGGITNGIWPPFDGEWWACSAATGTLFFHLYDETGKGCYLDAALNVAHWFTRLDEILRTADKTFVKYNTPGSDNFYPASPKASGSGILHQLRFYNAGAAHLLGQGLPFEDGVRRELDYFAGWCRENLLGRGHSAEFAEVGYDTRRIDGVIVNGTKLGAIPCQLYGLIRQKAIPEDMLAVADGEMQRMLTEINSHEEMLLTSFVTFATLSMAEKLQPGALMRTSVPYYEMPLKLPGRTSSETPA